jgi:hypothetical protein
MNQREGRLATEKKHLLDHIPFEWSGELNHYHNQHWDRIYQRLQHFYQQHGHSRVATETGNQVLLDMGFETQIRPISNKQIQSIITINLSSYT